MTKNVVWQSSLVDESERSECLGQRGCVVWLTGLSGSGKSTVARALEKSLIGHGHAAYVLDGDNVRHGLNSDLGFTPRDRTENIRRIGEVAGLFADSGIIAISAFISPYRADREGARQAARPHAFIEVFLDVPIEICESRDPKGLYKRARAGEISDFTGIDAPYERPETPEVTLRTDVSTVQEEVERLVKELHTRKILD